MEGENGGLWRNRINRKPNFNNVERSAGTIEHWEGSSKHVRTNHKRVTAE